MTRLAPESLLGAWSLLEWHVEAAGTDRLTWPFGRDAEGLLVYAPGWMSATLSQRRRTPLSAGSVRRADETSRARIVTEYLAYGGRWSMEGSTVIHEVSLALNPVLLGTRQVREVALRGAELTLSATEADGGQQRTHRLRWRRC